VPRSLTGLEEVQHISIDNKILRFA